MCKISYASLKNGRTRKCILLVAEIQNLMNFTVLLSIWIIKVITKLPNSEQSYKGKVKTHNYINRQNQSTTGKL
jgi:hypothetical protein